MSVISLAKPVQPIRESFQSYGLSRLASLWRGVMQEECPGQVREIFATMLDPWGQRPVPLLPQWRSEIGDDHSPFEFSMAIGGLEPELRVLFEAQGNAPSAMSNWEAGLALNERLEQKYGADLGRFRLIQDLFVPTEPRATFGLWHSVCLFKHSPPAWKVYVNPQAQGSGRAAAAVEEALVRLGYPRAWPILSTIAGQRGPDLDELKYLSLDLAKGRAARLKVYFRHHRVTASELEQAFYAARSHVAGDVQEFCRDMLDTEGPFLSKPVGSCFSFVEGDDERPSKATLHLPVARYAANDAMVAERVTSYLDKHRIPTERYEGPIQGFANRSLDDGVGMHSYVSFRREKTGRRLTLYLSPELFQVEPPLKSIRARRRALEVPPPEDIVARYEANSMADHPYFRRLAREPIDLRRVHLLLGNANEAIVNDFSRRLAGVIGRIDSDEIRSILVKQLNDELGGGDYSKAHKVLFQKMFGAIASLSPTPLTDEVIAPGKACSKRFETTYGNPNPYVGVGAAMVIEIYGKQVDVCVGDALRRLKLLKPDELAFIELHEELEIDHADESLLLAKLLPRSGSKVEAAWRGAEAICAAAWAFFDGVYQVTFG